MSNLSGSYLTGFKLGDQFLDYWMGLPRESGEALPRRATFNPMHVPRMLPHVFVANTEGSHDYRVTLRGTWLEEFVGKTNPHDNIFNFYTGKDRQDYEQFIDAVLHRPAIGIIERHFNLNSTSRYDFPSLFCPFLDQDGAPTIMIGVALMDGFKTWELEDPSSLLSKVEFNAFRLLDMSNLD